MKKWQKNALIICLSFLALIVIAVMIIFFHSANRGDNDLKKRARDGSGEKQGLPTVAAAVDIIEEMDDQSTLSGELTIVDCIEKSQDNPLVFYLLDGRPKKDASVDGVIVFYQGKAVIFDEDTIKGCFKEDRSIGNILENNQSDLVKKLTNEYSKQLDSLMNSAVATDTGVLCGLYLKGKMEAAQWFNTSYFFAKDSPENWEYYVSLFTDDSGNNVESEFMYIPRPFHCRSMIIKSYAGISEVRFEDDGKAHALQDYVVTSNVHDIDVKEKNKLHEWEESYEKNKEFLLSNDADIREDFWQVDLTSFVSGQIYNHNYLGFTVDGENTIISLCEPNTIVSPDTPAVAKKSSLVLVDPQSDDQLAVKYQISNSLYRSVESILEKENAVSFFDKYLNSDSARELVNSDSEYDRELGYALLEYLGLEEELTEAKYNRAKGLLDSGHFEEAYRIFKEIGREDEISESKYARANVLFSAGDYRTAWYLYEESGHNDDVLKCKYEIAKRALSEGDYEQAYGLLKETGHTEEIEKSLYERGCWAMDNEQYTLAEDFFSQTDYQDSKTLLELCRDMSNCYLKCDFDSVTSGSILEDIDEDIAELIKEDSLNYSCFLFDSVGAAYAGFSGVQGVNGSACLVVTGRTSSWNGIAITVDPRWYGKGFKISFDARCKSQEVGVTDMLISLTSQFQIKKSNGSIATMYPAYNRVVGTSVNGNWIHCEGIVFLPSDIYVNSNEQSSLARLYFECPDGRGDEDIYIDNLVMVITDGTGDFEAFNAYWEKHKPADE